MLSTDWVSDQFYIIVPGEGQKPKRLIRNEGRYVYFDERRPGELRGSWYRSFNRSFDHEFWCKAVEEGPTLLVRIADALEYIRGAEAEIDGLDDRNSDEAARIMRDALVRIDEQVLGLCFIDDAEKVVAHDRAYLKDFPYLEFVKPLWDEFDAMFLEWLGLKSSLYGKGDHDDDKSRRIGKKAYVR